MHYAELDRAWAELTAPGQPFEVTQIEVRGERLRAFRHAPPNVRALWLSTLPFADRDYLVYEADRLSYAQAHARVGSVAAWLAGQGVKPGDRVAIAMRNYPEWLLIYWACVSMGVAVVGMNAWWVAEEMAYAIQDSDPKAVFADAERLQRLFERPGNAQGRIVVAVRAPAAHPGVVAWDEVVANPGDFPAVEIDGDDDACVFYTSGTTGTPKGARLTHRGCINNLMSLSFAAQVQALAMSYATGEPVPAAPPPPVSIATTPMFHVTANNCLAHATTAAGGKIVLMRKWDAGEALRLVEAERATSISGVPTMAREMLHHPDLARRDVSSLQTLSGGGAPVPPDLVGKIDAHAAIAARPTTGYGMTETCGIITAVSGDFFADKPFSCGRAMPTFATRCTDDAGNDVPAGQAGELWVKGCGVIKGYLNRPEATAESITHGWLHTGDVARIDEHGFIFIVDRKKDMVLRGGENVYCAEVEAALFRHPDVAEACVFGVPDERLGEEVGAAVVLRPGAAATAADLRTLMSGFIAGHKLPRYVWISAEPLPRNANGKFLRRELRETLAVGEAG